MVLATTGPRRVARPARKNVSDSERAVSAAVGGLFVATGIKKRGLGGLALAFIGAELLRRGATGHCMLYESIGFSSEPGDEVTSAAATVNARKAIKIERTITINAPSDELYDFWRDFRNLPQVLEHIASVTELANGRTRWVAVGPAGTRAEWDAEIVNDIPGELIAWKTVGTPDVAHAGSVHFTPTAGGGTEVRLVMDYEPPGRRLAAAAAKVIGESPDQQIRSDLKRLKALFETRQTA